MNLIRKFSALIFLSLAAAASQSQPTIKPDTQKLVQPSLPKGMVSVEPAALELIRNMSKTLAAAKSLEFDSVVQAEFPSIDGIAVMYLTGAHIAMQRPNKFDVKVTGNGPDHEILYNGKQLFAFVPEKNTVAIIDSPDTIDATAAFAYEKAGMFFPGDDLILSDPFEHITRGITDAFVVGKTNLVGGVETNIVVMAGNDLQGQIWIGVKDNLPYMASWVYMGDKSRPRTTLTYKNWKLNTQISADSFDTSRFSKARVTEFSHPSAPAAK